MTTVGTTSQAAQSITSCRTAPAGAGRIPARTPTTATAISNQAEIANGTLSSKNCCCAISRTVWPFTGRIQATCQICRWLNHRNGASTARAIPAAPAKRRCTERSLPHARRPTACTATMSTVKVFSRVEATSAAP
ncbi:hypothetical protein MSEN_14780 [Mycolicibacter senuensis]|uniref:Uncharacterized protein n=1 Tax=Mycolicibacter senuensis TaxID=386913 RepID=A0A7I9XJ71_9MYCO|nr:hypothetical protein MSEN_14780 [Mycolicibacter senuensis]